VAKTRVALVLVEHASLANVFACFEDLMATNPLADTPPERPQFAPRIVAADPTAFRSLTGATVVPHRGLDPDVGYDAVIVPVVYDADGYLSTVDPAPMLTKCERDWLRDQHRGGALITTMCSGAFVLAEAGLLDGHESSMIPLYEHTDGSQVRRGGVGCRRLRRPRAHRSRTGGRTSKSPARARCAGSSVGDEADGQRPTRESAPSGAARGLPERPPPRVCCRRARIAKW